jgi:hypothetical protein
MRRGSASGVRRQGGLVSSLRFAPLVALMCSWVLGCSGSTSHNAACNDGDVESPASCAPATCGGALQSAVCHGGAFVCPAAPACKMGPQDAGPIPPPDSGPQVGTIQCGASTCSAAAIEYCRGTASGADAGPSSPVTYECKVMASLCAPPATTTCACIREFQGCDSVQATEVSCDDSKGNVTLVCSQ